MLKSIARIATVLACAGVFATASLAQTAAQRMRVRGVVESVDGSKLVLKARTGETMSVQLSADWAVSGIVKAALADIKPGAYVGAGAMPQADGTQKAVQVVIFPEAMRGTGEGFRPWDFLPESTMTNATVAETVQNVSGPAFTLKYKDGSKVITIPADAAIITFVPGERAELKAGAVVALTAEKAADGTMTTSRISVGRDGISPN